MRLFAMLSAIKSNYQFMLINEYGTVEEITGGNHWFFPKPNVIIFHVDLLSAFKLTPNFFQKKRPNLFKMCPNIKNVISAYEKLHQTGVDLNYQSYAGDQTKDQTLKPVAQMKISPSATSFWNIEMLPSFVDIGGGGKSQQHFEETLPKITSHIYDESTTNVYENFSIYRGVVLEYRVPKVWIDYQQKFDRFSRGSQLPALIKPEISFTKNRATKLSLAIIKAQMMFKRLLLKIRANLKNATYYNISMRTHIEYVKFSDGTVMRIVVISDTLAKGYNNNAAKKKTLHASSDKKHTSFEKKPPLHHNQSNISEEPSPLRASYSSNLTSNLRKSQNLSIPSVSTISLNRSSNSVGSYGI